jgi:hypothetical protein
MALAFWFHEHEHILVADLGMRDDRRCRHWPAASGAARETAHTVTLGSRRTPEVERYWASGGICVVRQNG